jgi:hypothetical protein
MRTIEQLLPNTQRQSVNGSVVAVATCIKVSRILEIDYIIFISSLNIHKIG